MPHGSVTLDEGFWSHWQAVNRRVALPHGYAKLEESRALENFRLAAEGTKEGYSEPRWRDQDLYKWLESAAYELPNDASGELRKQVERAVEVIAAAQAEDGYLHTYHQVLSPDTRWSDLGRDHEMYCAGHLIEAALALQRVDGNDRLLEVACRVADHIGSVFGPGKRHGAPGHPEIELALVELYRATNRTRYLNLAQFLVDERGHGHVGPGWYNNPVYHQDHVPVLEAARVEGHAVRQLYLTTGVTDLYLETGERALLDAVSRQWHDMTTGHLFVTGGVGARHEGEAFGERYELPNDRCYCETCAAIGSVFWNWRLLLITGEGRFADLIERTLYNSVLNGISLDGRSYFYGQVLLSRGNARRSEWFDCACCPPNVTRVLASLPHYFATSDTAGVQMHQYAPGTISSGNPLGVRLRVETGYPWQGEVHVFVEETATVSWTLRLRIPAWASAARLRVNGTSTGLDVRNGYAAIERAWRKGDRIELELPIAPRLIEANPRIDATRGSLAIERGPLVYCLEDCDQEPGVDIMDAAIDGGATLADSWQPELLGGVATVDVPGVAHDMAPWGDALYKPAGDTGRLPRKPVTLTAIPYYAWANRGAHAMRVWIPRGTAQ
ncbi:MAG: glycoside hydrolase family 127 protein [Verrucomicrobia bacterium]|nr:glycoside hydrolase family 127 protein [Verrucomicrobiota bacterium]